MALLMSLLLSSPLFVGLLCFASEYAHENVNCTGGEREALLRLKRSFYDPDGYLSSWIGEDHCRWKGVGCHNQTGHVLKLDFSLYKTGYIFEQDFNLAPHGYWNARLGGKIDPSLICLKYLEYLDLRYNNFNWMPIPEFIASLKSLRHLDLSTARFGGIIPQQLGNLSKLQFLDVSDNSLYYDSHHTAGITLHDGQWLGHLSSLQQLDLSNVMLGGAPNLMQGLSTLPFLFYVRLCGCQLHSLPQTLTRMNFSSLSELHLCGNHINLPVPQWLFNITSLEILNLSDNIFAGVSDIAAIRNLCKLKVLDLSYNDIKVDLSKIQGNFSDCLQNSLEKLKLNYNSFYGPVLPSALSTLSSLRYLDLSHNAFNDLIPSALEGLSSLKYLDLSNNKLSGPFPSNLSRLSSLQLLDLSFNKFNGPIPSYFGGLSSLRKLNLGSNSFNCSIPWSIDSLSSLEVLDLSVNDLSGPIPETLGKLSSLTYLNLRKNQLSGVIPSSLWRLGNLSQLLLQQNNLEGVLSESFFSNLTKLSDFRISDNKAIKINISEDWQPPTSLRKIYMSKCKVGPHFPKWVHHIHYEDLELSSAGIADKLPEWIWVGLSYLNLSHNQISGQLPRTMSDLFSVDLSSNLIQGPLPAFKGVIFLVLSNNSLSGSLWELMPDYMRYLSLSNNKLSGTVPSTFCSSRNIEVVDLSMNEFSGKLPGSLFERPTYLNLANNNFQGSIPDISSCNLKSLHLNRNNLSGTFPLSLKTCKELEVLDLSENRLTGTIPSWISYSMPSLKILCLKSNMFSGSIHPHLSDLSELQIMDLASNELSGSMPRSFGNLKAMKVAHYLTETPPYSSYLVTYKETIMLIMNGQKAKYEHIVLGLATSIDLSDNSLIGEIPCELGNLLILINLNLSGNHLVGVIPENLSKLQQLNYLDLSRNYLSGEIPQSLVKLSFLSKLNLSYNNLSGIIPTGSQFATFSNSSYAGNPNLCVTPFKGCEIEIHVAASHKTDAKNEENVGLYLCLVFGFIVGFWSFYGILLLKMSWRHAYFQFIDGMHGKI